MKQRESSLCGTRRRELNERKEGRGEQSFGVSGERRGEDNDTHLVVRSERFPLEMCVLSTV